MKKFLIGFIIAGIAIMAVPLAAMTFRPTVSSTDNRKMAEFPGLTDAKGGVNLGFFSGFENWFKDHFAFRNELIYADARIQNDVFKVSNVESVVSGKDGWLFYKSTLNDYLGTERLSERELYNVAYNLSIAYDYIRGKGCDFVLAIPANKNTLYGENMPYYYSLKADDTQDTDVLTPILGQMEIPYADLIKAFKDEDEVLYLKTDSHWSNKGAILAYNTIMDALGYAHDDHSASDLLNKAEEAGDLSRMVYTFYGQKEENDVYDTGQNYEYLGNFSSVEDGRIETSGAGSNGKLLMFRDSFGNTLVPLIANEFSEGFFTRENLYALERHMEERQPDTVIFEKVQRNLKEFITMPPVISAPVYEGTVSDGTGDEGKQKEGAPDLTIKPFASDAAYYEISGTVNGNLLNTDTDVLAEINGVVYRAYHTGENGFAVYLKKDDLILPAEVRVLVTGETVQTVEAKTFTDVNEQITK